MNISKIKSRKDLDKLLRKELYDWELGFPVNKAGVFSSIQAHKLILDVFDKAQSLINKPVETTNEQPNWSNGCDCGQMSCVTCHG